MKETYFVIRNSDGDTTVNAVSKEELLKQIEDGEFGKEGKNIVSSIPDHNTNYWGDGVIIIKGKMVVPRGEFVITKFNIE
jgi:hypothetical protein